MCHAHENTESYKGNRHDNKFISPRFLLNRHDAKIRQYPDHGMQYWIAWKNRPLPFRLLPPMKVQDLYMWAYSFLWATLFCEHWVLIRSICSPLDRHSLSCAGLNIVSTRTLYIWHTLLSHLDRVIECQEASNESLFAPYEYESDAAMTHASFHFVRDRDGMPEGIKWELLWSYEFESDAAMMHGIFHFVLALGRMMDLCKNWAKTGFLEYGASVFHRPSIQSGDESQIEL